MQIRCHFPETAHELKPHYLQNEAAHNIQLAILPILDRWENPFVLVAEQEDKVLGTLISTLFFLLEAETPEVARQLAKMAFLYRPDCPKVQGPPEVTIAFVQTWEEHTGRKARLEMHECIYQLTHVQAPAVPGHLRKTSPGDHPLLAEWAIAFTAEALNDPLSPEDAAKVAARDAMFVWEVDGQPVSLAASAGKTPHGIRVNFVYTPPEHRGKGYASANVAALSQQLLNEGNQFCFLFTDLSNPTSNRIYQQIGYQKVTPIDKYRL